MRDLRDTIRLLGRNPGFVAAVALTLGAAIAANTAVFSIINGLVLRRLPAPHPDRLVRLYPVDTGHVRQNLAAYDDYRAYRDAGSALADVAAYVPEQVTVATRDRPAARRIACFGYVAGTTTLALAIAGLAPALAGTRLDLAAALHGETVVGAQRIAPALLRRALLFAQVAGTTVLLVTGGLLARAARQAEVVDLGFDPAGVFMARPDVLQSGGDVAEAARVARALLERAASVAGPANAALVSHVPLTGGARFTNVVSPGADRPSTARVACRIVTTTPGYFGILKVPFVSGRTFGPSETSAAVVGEVLARRLWPDGRGLARPLRMADTGREYHVVGVVRDTRASALWRDKEAAVYLAPSGEAEVASLALVIRAPSSNDRGVAAAMAAILRGISTRTPARVERLSDLVALWMLPSRLAAGSSLAIAAAALGLALVGAYAATSVAVKRRARELGIRIALGATPRDVARAVMGEGLAVSAIHARRALQ